MKISAVETYPVRIPLKAECRMVSALGKYDVSEFLIVRLLTDEGIEGVGEASVAVRWSGETVWGSQVLVDRILAPLIQGCDPLDVTEIERRMDAVCRNNWFTKSAIEMACWDLQGKTAGRPVYELMGGACRSLAVRSRFSIGAYTPQRAADRAAQLIGAGFDTIKVKVGGTPADDIDRVRAVRDAIGPEPALIIDANAGWDVDTAIRCVNELVDCNLNLVEQPTPNRNFAAMALFRRETTPPVMADDICFDLADAEQLIEHACCDVISIYPGKNGGIGKSRQIAELAQRHGVACAIGSNIEFDIATAAMGHLAVATENVQVEKYPGDMIGPIYYESRIVSNPLAIEGPMTTMNDRPGLGIDVDWAVVRAHGM